MSRSTGRVSQIQGAVVDCQFAVEELPEIYEAVEIVREGGFGSRLRRRFGRGFICWQSYHSSMEYWTDFGFLGFVLVSITTAQG